MKAAVVFLSLLGSLIISGTSQGSPASNDLSKKALAQKVLADYNQARRSIVRAQIPEEIPEKILAKAACAQKIINGIESSSMSDDNILIWAFDTFVLYNYDLYFISARSSRKALRQQALVLRKKTSRLLKNNKSKSSRKIACSLRAQGSLALFFIKNVDVNFCALESRIEELGGYRFDNLEKAFSKALRDSGLADFLGNDAVFVTDNRVYAGVKEMRKIGPPIKQRSIDRYEEGLLNAILDQIAPKSAQFLKNNKVFEVGISLEVIS